MEERKADNIIMVDEKTANSSVYATKKRIDSIDNRISEEKSKMKDLDDMEELFVSLSKNISKCVELLNKSVKGRNVNSKLNAIEENNKINFQKSINNIDIQREEIKNNLIKLNDQKETIQEQLKENYKEQENRENKDETVANNAEEIVENKEIINEQGSNIF